MKRNQIIMIALIITAAFSPVQFAISEPVSENAVFIYIQSRFMLWDTNEKMIDGNFSITMISMNETALNDYRIIINGNVYNGTFNRYEILMFDTNESYLTIHIEINGNPELTLSNIKVINNVTGGGISSIGEPFKISLSPLEWSKQEWNIFYSVVVSALISIIVSYIIVMRYRKLNGVVEIK